MLTVRELLLRQDKGDISAEEIISECQKEVSIRDPLIKGFIYTSWQRAREKARQIDQDRARGGDRPPLAGIPVAIKDNLARSGEPMTCCSRFLKGFYPGYTATAVSRLEKAGAIIIGRTNMDELAMGSSTENSCYFPTHNPHNPDYVPGGSSGGAAAGVGGGLVPLSLGSETGGSIRQPAAFCGVYGLRPTYGRVSRFGLTAYASSLDQVGPLSGNLEDLWLVLKEMAGPDELDATTLKEPLKGPEDPDDWRIGLPREYLEHIQDPEISRRVQEIAAELEKAGVVVEEISLSDPTRALAIYSSIVPAEASSNLARLDGIRYGLQSDNNYETWEQFIRENRGKGLGEEVRNRIILGTKLLNPEGEEDFLARGQQARRELKEEMQAIFKEFDLILSPATPTPSFKMGSSPEHSLQRFMSDIFAIPASLTGLPALTVPAGLNSKKLPLAIQLMGPWGSEGRLLGLARLLERITGYGPVVNDTEREEPL